MGRARFGKYRNPFTDDEEVRDRPHGRQHHAGLARRPSADGEGGWAPLSRRSRTLETIGSHDFDGALKSETMTAHVRIDASTGELFFYGYEADGLASKKVAYCMSAPMAC
jgi:carotenoid cleavage dioxygenase